MAKFMLKARCGPHRVGNFDDAVMYYPGDIIVSDDNLIKKFPNKFMLVPEDDEPEPEPKEPTAIPAARQRRVARNTRGG